MVSKKTLNRDSKPEDWVTSLNFLTILLSEFTYLSKIKGFCRVWWCSSPILPVQPGLWSSAVFSLPCLSLRQATCCITRAILQAELRNPLFSCPVRLYCTGREKTRGRQRIFFVLFSLGLVGLCLVLTLKIYNSGMTFSGLFSKLLLDYLR